MRNTLNPNTTTLLGTVQRRLSFANTNIAEGRTCFITPTECPTRVVPGFCFPTLIGHLKRVSKIANVRLYITSNNWTDGFGVELKVLTTLTGHPVSNLYNTQ